MTRRFACELPTSIPPTNRRSPPSSSPLASSGITAPSSPAFSHAQPDPAEQDKIHETKCVRFLIPPPSPPPETEDEMSDSGLRRSARVPQRAAHIVMTTDPTPEKKKFGAVNKWGAKQLDWLKVKFVKEELDLNEIPGFGGVLASQLQDLIDRGVKQLTAFTLDEIRLGIDDEDYRERAPDFRPTFMGLADSMVRDDTKEVEKQAGLEQRTTQQTPATVPPAPSPIIWDAPRTPDQPTRPQDPKDSGSSAESKPEAAPNALILDFLRDCTFCLGRSFRQLSWPQTQNTVRLALSRQTGVTFCLGKEMVSPKNDGCLTISYVQNNITSTWKYKAVPPVLGIEAKRMSAKKRADPNFKYWYAAQVFGEMLGQVCFHDFFMNPHMTYQEAFIIHIVHTTVYIYYCKFPKRYLAEITKYGAQYSDMRSPRGSGVVKLRRTKPFHLRKTSERVDLFHLIAQLWRYLVSGNSHVGYLYNYPENPIHKIGQVMEMGERREGEIDLESVEDDYESEEGDGDGELEWEYEYDLGDEDDGSEEGERSGGQESSGDSSYSPSLTGSMMEVDT